MIDTHCHILPLCDDGAESWKQSLAMARAAVTQGITAVIATPHHLKSNYRNEPAKIRDLTDKLNRELSEANVPLRIYPGQEYHLDAAHAEDVDLGQLQTLADSPYALIELPSGVTPRKLKSIIANLHGKGIIPVIAHPERHRPFMQEPEMLRDWISRGALFQMTALSLNGNYGPDVQRAAVRMARDGAIHLMATDAHEEGAKRGFGLKEAYGKLAEEIGEARAETIRRNAEQVVTRGVIDRASVEMSAKPRRRWFGR